jgi:hypothetical protein
LIWKWWFGDETRYVLIAGAGWGSSPRATKPCFLPPAPESDSDFRLAPGSFTKLENLILNHHTRSYIGSSIAMTPEFLFYRGFIHFALFLICFYFGFIRK